MRSLTENLNDANLAKRDHHQHRTTLTNVGTAPRCTHQDGNRALQRMQPVIPAARLATGNRDADQDPNKEQAVEPNHPQPVDREEKDEARRPTQKGSMKLEQTSTLKWMKY